MTRIPQTSPLLRLAAAAIAVGALLPLSGCLAAQIPTDTPDGDAPAPTSAPTSTPSDQPESDMPATTMTFADGTTIPASARIEWGDGFMFDEGWKSVKPDDGNGGWTYGTVDDTCTARFWQGMITDVPTVAGDDSASSDAMLAVILDDTSAAEITPLATTEMLSYITGSNPALESRRLVGEDGARTWSISARAFTATGAGVYVVVDCTGGDVDAVMADIVDKNAVVISE